MPDVDGAGYAAWFAHGFDRPADWEERTKDLPGNGAELEGDYKELRQSWDEASRTTCAAWQPPLRRRARGDVRPSGNQGHRPARGELHRPSEGLRRHDRRPGRVAIDLVRAAVHEQRAFLGAELKLASGDVGGAVKHLLGDSFNGPGTSFVSQHRSSAGSP